MTEESCGFSCTYCKKKIYEQLNGLIEFSKYDPETALKIADELSANIEYTRRIVYQNAS